MNRSQVILFDGVCNLCNNAINFIIDRDTDQLFSFAPLQSDFGQQKIKEYQIPTNVLDSIVLIKGEKAFVKSNAALEIVKQLKGGWSLLYIFKIVPLFIRNGLYDIIAKNRYRWFGSEEKCRIPTPELMDRFVG